MATHGTIRRFTLEIEKIRRGQYPSFKEIKEYLLYHGFEIVGRTIQRDIEQIRFEFGIEIKYDRAKNGYFIDYENSLNFEPFFRFLEIAGTAELLTDSLKENKEILQYVSFYGGGGLKGIEHLPSLLRAVKEHCKISFVHYNFHTGKKRKYTIKPYLLKEYENRWYVIGQWSKAKKLRTFGIDRIDNLTVLPETFNPDPDINPTEIFDSTIGVVYSPDKPQRIVLSFTPTQGKYIKTLPLHKSQEILVDDDTELRISLFVVPNYELKQIILKHGPTVKVLEPKRLANEIKEDLKQALKKYK